MRVGVLGTGNVGQTLASKLISLGEQVMMRARPSGNEKAVAWAKEAGPLAGQGSFADAARFGELIVNATAGIASLEALRESAQDGSCISSTERPCSQAFWKADVCLQASGSNALALCLL